MQTFSLILLKKMWNSLQWENLCSRSLTSWEFMDVTTGTDPQADTHSAWLNNTQRILKKLWGGSFCYFTTSLKGFRWRQQNKAGIRIPGESQCLRTMAASIVYSHSVNHTLRSAIPDLSPTDLRTAKTFWRLNSSGRRFWMTTGGRMPGEIRAELIC